MLANYQRRWRATWNPDMYHGWGQQRKYFEGWYFKIVDPGERFAFALIPGISYGKDGETHAFIQVLDGKKCTATYHRFEASDFQPSDQRFELNLGDNFFSTHSLRLALPELQGELQWSDRYPWPRMLGAPGIMGWYSFVPFMECYHGVVSMHHTLQGELQVYGETIDFNGGKGYIEKDWGESFPNSWIWMQSNHFDAPHPVCLMASVAKIPWLGSHFIGYIVGFLLGDRLYRFATYTGAMMQADFDESTVQLAFKDRRYRLNIGAHKAEGGELLSPLSGNMTGKVNESMQATISVQFFDGEQLLFEGTGRNAGLEVAGPAQELLTHTWRR
ncbi:MAG TPA: tocopherol cyclase family protein [Saprospiraceae bacterium]|nr:tocopherol cyclase family protein [Saprospiraceae bacterium]HMP23582.1 tocopherol cyclase family protein [Saprospiraceae bacterium]